MAQTLKSKSKYGRTRRQRKKQRRMRGGFNITESLTGLINKFKPATQEEACEEAKNKATEICNASAKSDQSAPPAQPQPDQLDQSVPPAQPDQLDQSVIPSVQPDQLDQSVIPSDLRSLITIGFLGAYTTFSTYSLETVNLLREGEIRLCLTNVVLSNVLGLMLVIMGMQATRILLKIAR